jgi:hypothetical protein
VETQRANDHILERNFGTLLRISTRVKIKKRENTFLFGFLVFEGGSGREFGSCGDGNLALSRGGVCSFGVS